MGLKVFKIIPRSYGFHFTPSKARLAINLGRPVIVIWIRRYNLGGF